MNESSTATAVKTTAPKAAKSNGKAEKPAKKTSTQRDLLVKALKGMKKPATQKQLEAKSGLEHRATYHHLFCLRRDGHVKSSEIGKEDGLKEVAWELTANGRKL